MRKTAFLILTKGIFPVKYGEKRWLARYLMKPITKSYLLENKVNDISLRLEDPVSSLTRSILKETFEKLPPNTSFTSLGKKSRIEISPVFPLNMDAKPNFTHDFKCRIETRVHPEK